MTTNMYEKYLQNERNVKNILIDLTDKTGFDHSSGALEAFTDAESKLKSHNRLSLIKVMKALEKELEEKMGDYKCDNRNAKDNSEHLLTAGKCQAQEETLAKIREFISKLEQV